MTSSLRWAEETQLWGNVQLPRAQNSMTQLERLLQQTFWFYDLTTVQDMDADGDGIINGTRARSCLSNS